MPTYAFHGLDQARGEQALAYLRQSATFSVVEAMLDANRINSVNFVIGAGTTNFKMYGNDIRYDAESGSGITNDDGSGERPSP